MLLKNKYELEIHLIFIHLVAITTLLFKIFSQKQSVSFNLIMGIICLVLFLTTNGLSGVLIRHKLKNKDLSLSYLILAIKWPLTGILVWLIIAKFSYLSPLWFMVIYFLQLLLSFVLIKK